MKEHSHVSCRTKMTSMRTRAACVALCLCSSSDKPWTGASPCAYWQMQTEGAKETWCLPNQCKKGEEPKVHWLHSAMLIYQLRSPHLNPLHWGKHVLVPAPGTGPEPWPPRHQNENNAAIRAARPGTSCCLPSSPRLPAAPAAPDSPKPLGLV